MILWMVLTTMTAIAAVWAAMPFLRRADASELANEAMKSSGVFRDQFRQIDDELKAGVISAAEAEATRIEVARRLILAEREEGSQTEPVKLGNRNFAAIGIAGAIALGSSILYINIGDPDRMPRVQAGNDLDGSMGALPPRHPSVSGNSAGASADPSGAAGTPAGARETGVPTVAEMIERLAQRLKTNPEDADGWRVLGWSYTTQERYKEAAAAYDEAIKRLPEDGELHAARGEVLVRAGNGLVSTEAANAFEEALKRDKEDPRARFFLGLKKEQAGERNAALDDWVSLLASASSSEPWVHDLRERVEQLAAELKVDISGRLPAKPPAAPAGDSAPQMESQPEPHPVASSTNDSGLAHPSAADVERAETMSPEDRSAMIRSMVDKLASRLEAQPRDLEGWSRLIRSHTVLGDADKAKAAMAKAREIFADTPDALASIGSIARELGLEP